MRATSIQSTTHDGLARARVIRIERQLHLSRREAEAFHLVGATTAAGYWRRRAARLASRLDRLQGGQS